MPLPYPMEFISSVSARPTRRTHAHSRHVITSIIQSARKLRAEQRRCIASAFENTTHKVYRFKSENTRKDTNKAEQIGMLGLASGVHSTNGMCR